MPEKIRAIRFLTFPYDSLDTHFQWTRVRLGTIQTGFHTQSSRSSFSPAFLWNKIGLIICILTLRWHKRWWECLHKAKAQKEQPKYVCEGHNLSLNSSMSLHTCVIWCLPNTFICKPDRLHAFVQFQSSGWLYKANIDQLLLHPKPPLCPFLLYKVISSAHIACVHKCTHQHPECTGSYATRWLDMSESHTSVCIVRTKAGVGLEGVDGNGRKKIGKKRAWHFTCIRVNTDGSQEVPYYSLKVEHRKEEKN